MVAADHWPRTQIGGSSRFKCESVETHTAYYPQSTLMLKGISIPIPRNYQRIEGKSSLFAPQIGLSFLIAHDLAALIAKKDTSLVVIDVRDLDFPGGRKKILKAFFAILIVGFEQIFLPQFTYLILVILSIVSLK